MPPEYEVFALRYARHERMRHHNFLPYDVHDDAPMPMDYFVWAIRGDKGTILVDTGFNQAAATRRGRVLLASPADALERLGTRRDEVRTAIITHLHYDHAGNLDLFPSATFHLQDDEMAFATGRHMCEHVFAQSFNPEDVLFMVKSVFEGRVRFHKGSEELAPGITVHRVGGHTDGLQVVRVRTRRGWVVLASDATHYYENLRRRSPYPTVFNIGDMMQGYQVCEALADSPDHIVPGHDPEVLRIYPRVGIAGLEAVALHLAPKAE